ncbi:MAG: phospho-N-acetylmuramoyl-pentapeptide-transferase [Phycisphaerae bacterium]|nr:phospho-N-acetylmuramoyl-pentapeptide-transferase [Phycisphaerae bacterium]MBM92961.1 phospho-N-acetylmuramoyl-pentapeptide-transferase [Phycisphaerae bacterium]
MIYILIDILRNWLDEHRLYALLSVFDQIQFRSLLAAGLSYFIVVFFGKRVIRFLVSMKIGDGGETDAELLREHAASKANVPTMGGILIVGAIFISTFLLADIRVNRVYLGLFTLVWLAAVGGADDWLKLTAARRGTGRQGLYSWEKLVFQLGIGAIVGYFGYRYGIAPDGGDSLAHVLNLPFQRTYDPLTKFPSESLIYLGMPVFVLISTLMVAGVSNAVNITDGMDGLAAGSSGIVSFGLILLALIAGTQSAAQYLLVPYVPFTDELAVMAGAMAGACLGFLWWNCKPAQVFMGDTGSLALGGSIGYIAVMTRQEFVVLLMCGVFLMEIGSVVIQVGWFKYTRIKTGTGRRIFRIAPYHHHLHQGGWAENQVVVRLWLIAILFSVVALATMKLR